MDGTLLNAFEARAEEKERSRAECKNFNFPGIGELQFQKLSQKRMLDILVPYPVSN